MKRAIYTVFIFLVLAVAGCYYDKGELIYPPVTSGTVPANCDTSAVTYKVDIVNILKANCYTCHDARDAGGSGYILDNYNGLRTFASNGRLLRAIDHTGPPNTYMPQGGSKLAACDIARIRTWIRNGFPNN